MAGARCSPARAALAAGAGRVFVGPLDAAAPLLDAAQPELMLRPLDWGLAPRRWRRPPWSAAAAAATRCAACCRRLSRAPRAGARCRCAQRHRRRPALHTLLRARAARGLATVLTPHPLEAARLLGLDDARGAGRPAARRAAAGDELRCVVVLKGSGSVIAAPGAAPLINPTGNAALASAGTGDVLAGWIGGAWAACVLPTWRGRCAAGVVVDVAARRGSRRGHGERPVARLRPYRGDARTALKRR